MVNDLHADHRLRLRRDLLVVLLCDASACAALAATALAHRSQPSGRKFAAAAGVALAGFVPGAVAVVRERRAHRHPPVESHRMTGSTLLFASGLVINTVGSVAILTRTLHGPVRSWLGAITDIALLIGGDAIGVPYIALVGALHADSRSGTQ